MANRNEAAKRGGQTQRSNGEKLRREMTLRALGEIGNSLNRTWNNPTAHDPLTLIAAIRKLLDDLERSLQ